MREDYVFADREVVGSYGLRAQSEREPPICTQVLIDRQVGEGVPKDRYGWQIEELEARLTRRKARSRPLSRPVSTAASGSGVPPLRPGRHWTGTPSPSVSAGASVTTTGYGWSISLRQVTLTGW